jgi:serine/threonine protein kinase
MSDEQTAPTARCPQCDGEMIRHADQEFCPVCLMQEGMRSSTVAGARFSWTPPTPEELADKFPGLEIQALLGQGGMGAVYRVRQIELDRIAALKILPEQMAQEPGFSERFLREARLLASLSHPHIVTVYEFGQRAGTCFLLMEFVDGVTLRQALRTEPIHRLSPKEALTIVGQLCDALQFAHDEGVIHRDIKPENILIDKRGRVKIADFGLARMLGKSAGMLTLTGTNQLLGTPIYMAPEQIEGTGTVDHRVDIYSMGVVFYELLTGELPIGRFSPPSQRTELDARLDEVVLRALEKQPERRYQQASEVRTAVDGFRNPAHAAGSSGTKRRRRFGPVVQTVATFAAGAVFVLSLPHLLNWIDGWRTRFEPIEFVDTLRGTPSDDKASMPNDAVIDPPATFPGYSDEFGSGMSGGYASGMMGGPVTIPDASAGAPGGSDMQSMGGFGESGMGDAGYAAGGLEGYPGGGGYPDDMMVEAQSDGPVEPVLTFDAGTVQLNRDRFSQPVEDLEAVDAILTDMHRLYLKLEQHHSVVTQEGDVVRTVILIDPSDLDALINQLWTRLDDTVSREHQRELRDLLPLYSAAHPQMGDMAGGYPGMSGGMGMSGGGAGIGSGVAMGAGGGMVWVWEERAVCQPALRHNCRACSAGIPICSHAPCESVVRAVGTSGAWSCLRKTTGNTSTRVRSFQKNCCDFRRTPYPSMLSRRCDQPAVGFSRRTRTRMSRKVLLRNWPTRSLIAVEFLSP